MAKFLRFSEWGFNADMITQWHDHDGTLDIELAGTAVSVGHAAAPQHLTLVEKEREAFLGWLSKHSEQIVYAR